jgi:hypothetical protein
MAKKKKQKIPYMPKLTKQKMIRLAIFAVITTAGFLLNNYVSQVQTFGWGFTFGMLAMASLTG